MAWCGRQNYNVSSFLWSFGRKFRNKWIIRFLKTLKGAQIHNCTCQIYNSVRMNYLKDSLHIWVEIVENACNPGLLHKLIFQQNEVHSQTIPWSKKVKSTAEVPNKWCHHNEKWVEHSSSSNRYSSEASLPQRWKLPRFERAGTWNPFWKSGGKPLTARDQGKLQVCDGTLAEKHTSAECLNKRFGILVGNFDLIPKGAMLAWL